MRLVLLGDTWVNWGKDIQRRNGRYREGSFPKHPPKGATGHHSGIGGPGCQYPHQSPAAQTRLASTPARARGLPRRSTQAPRTGHQCTQF